MGKKIDSIKEMYSLGLPAPKCIFIFEGDDIDSKINEYLNFPNSEFYTVRTDTDISSMSCKRLLIATRTEVKYLSHSWHDEGFQIILQEFIDERNEIKSGNMWLKDDIIILEGANDKHIRFTNGLSLDLNLSVNRFDDFKLNYHKFFLNQNCFSISEIFRLIRLARKVPYTNAIIEFSFFKNGSLYFWEIKK